MKNESRKFTHYVPIVGVVIAIALLGIAAFQYSGDVEWTRVTVSLLCAPELPDGSPNPGRLLSIIGLLLLCTHMAILFQCISLNGTTPAQQSTIQIGGMGSMVYALLTATPMHDLMVNIALVFFVVATIAIVKMLHGKQHYLLAILGIICLVVKLLNVSMYYANVNIELWGLLQKLTFILTTIWLFSVHIVVKANTVREPKPENFESHFDNESIAADETLSSFSAAEMMPVAAVHSH